MTSALYLSPSLDRTFEHAAEAAAASQRAQPFAPVSLLLPDSAAVQAAQKRLGDTVGVRFFQFYGLGQQVLDSARLPVFRLSDTALHRLVRQILSRMASTGRLTTFQTGRFSETERVSQTVWETPGLTQVLVNWLHEMKSQGIAPEAVQAHARSSGQERDRQLAEFYSAYQSFLIQQHCADSDGLLWLAAEALEGQPGRASGPQSFSQQLFIAIGFDQFNPLQVRILRACAPHCADLRIYLPWDACRPAGSLALARLAQTRQILEDALAGPPDSLILRVETLLPSAPASLAGSPASLVGSPASLVLRQIQRTIFEANPQPQPTPDAGTEALGLEGPPVNLIAAPSREGEVRWALKAVKRLLLAGADPEQIAILVPTPQTYQDAVEAIAEEYGVPIQMEHRLSAEPAAAALLNVLGLAGSPASLAGSPASLASEFPRRETLDALRSPYFTLPSLSPAQVNLLDQLSRERPVLAGREQWRFALQPLAPSEKEDVEDEDHYPDRLARQLAPSVLAEIEIGLTAFFNLVTPPETATCRDYTLWLQQAILGLSDDPDSLDGLPASLEPDSGEEPAPAAPPPSLNMARTCLASPNAAYARRDVRVLNRITRGLSALVEASELVGSPASLTEPGEGTLTWQEFKTDLQRVLLSLTIPADPLQPGVRFGAIQAGRSLGMDHLFVLGLAEGEFPRLTGADVLYSPHERETHPLPLIRFGHPQGCRPASGEQAALWWQVLINCRRTLSLLRPRLDDKGAPWQASSYWEAVLTAAQRGHPGLNEIVLPILTQPVIADSASPAELLVAVSTSQARGVPPELRQAWQSSQQAIQILRLRQGWQPTPAFDGRLQDPAILTELSQRFGPRHPWSASRLNRFGNCPFAFFAQTVLKLAAVADPTEGLDVMQRGALLHAILEDLFSRLTRGDFSNPAGVAITPANLPEIETQLAECCARAFRHAPQRYGFRPDALWQQEQAELSRMLAVLVRWECEQNGAAPPFQPFRQELRFGMPGSELPALSITGQAGGPPGQADFEFLLHGVIDRLDRDEQGRLRLIDYKSGSTSYSKPDMARGLAFQSPFYALAAEQLLHEQVAESYYLLIPKREKSGQLKFQGSVTGDEIVSKAIEQAARFVQDARLGRFPVLSAKTGMGQNSCTSSCEFAGLCRADRHAFAKARREAGQ